ncbi:MAG: M23 family metallopeptidase [Clostridia bacterium]|nr:M23 family metallopeptidase [Clostridia bacterium]
MRREFRKKQKSNSDKILVYSIAGVVVLLSVVFALIMYGNSLDKEVRQSQLSSDQIANIVKNEENSESASSSIGKSIEEAEEKQYTEKQVQEEKQNAEKQGQEKKKNEEKVVKEEMSKIEATNNQKSVNNTQNNTATTNATKTKEDVKEDKKEEKKELSFQMPVEGEIVKEYAKENLVFSETLQEWVTHDGIDIKAEKTSVVQSAEDGTVKSIKNDPRYGLTIVIEHENGYQTVYANLLSSEFVTEGEKVVKGQSIGTIGNTAAFESADEPHLHFEVIKDNTKVDPTIYVK